MMKQSTKCARYIRHVIWRGFESRSESRNTGNKLKGGRFSSFICRPPNSLPNDYSVKLTSHCKEDRKSRDLISMVRATIACAWCRRSKIKCVHNGESPCRSCLKSNRAGCVLSGPFEPGHPSYEVRNRGSKAPTSLRGSSTGTSTVRQSLDPGTVNRRSGDNKACAQCNSKEAVMRVPPQVILEVATIFNRKFPELAFLHLPTFSSRVERDATMWIQNAAMLALCHRFLPVATKVGFPAEDILISYAREGLQSVQSIHPNIPVVQALLIMSTYEWGAANGHAAWMYSGMATRMMQSLDAMKIERLGELIDNEIYNRTFWACFVMDRFIFSGKSQSLALPVDRMTIELPIGEEDFAFGMTNNSGRSIEATGPFTVDTYYTVLIRGFEIWSKVLDLITSGGRRKPGMSKPENCPWMTGSPWRTLLDSVEEWRSQHSDRLKFPTTSVAIHVSLGHGEKFAYVNLLYYVCILFLNREYIPFLPIQLSEPVGPIDPPLLQATAPPGWWRDRAKDLFNAAECITMIHQQLDLLNTPLLTPFPAFCSFCAGSMNGYVTSFPHMNLNRSPNSAAYEELDFLHLDKFTKLWKLGAGWVQTLKRVKNLRSSVTQDRVRFIGKTRSDYAALDESIHDYAGTTPSARIVVAEPSEITQVSLPIVGNEPDHASVVNLQGTSDAHLSPVLSLMAPILNTDISLTGDENWDQAWPMWGDQQFLSFDDGETQFNYDPDLPSF
ncbi:hypothetical protein VTL71DRAFT_12148 [Oculimacula yallundae]|uniref:Zn(2)-C6 fungal-type domain-containing protein n=1 Tax=Oculimacula yallundae TaxID=86028 RepID=A0ABR4CSG6_9HELO